LGEFHVSKLAFTTNQLYIKYEQLVDKAERLELTRDKRIAELARKQFPFILDPEYDPNVKSKKVHSPSAVKKIVPLIQIAKGTKNVSG